MKKILLALLVLQNGIEYSIIKKQLLKMGQELDDLKTEVSETKGIMQSAKVLLQGLKKRLDDAIASGNPADLVAIRDDLSSGSDELAQAITDNTPTT